MRCSPVKVNRRFGGTSLQGGTELCLLPPTCWNLVCFTLSVNTALLAAYLMPVSCLAQNSTLKMEVIYCPESSVDFHRTAIELQDV